MMIRDIKVNMRTYYKKSFPFPNNDSEDTESKKVLCVILYEISCVYKD